MASPARPAAAAPASTAPAAKNDSTASAASASAAVRDLADKVNRLAVNAGTAAKSANKTEEAPATGDSSPTAPQARLRQQPGSGNFVANAGNSRGRGGFRGAFGSPQGNRKVEVPSTDYDFQSNNEKFNKQDLVKEAIASGTEENIPHVAVKVPEVVEQPNGDGAADVVIPPPKDGFYNRKSSFFDNISCENKERAEAVPGERRGGAQFRSEEQKKNLETFGQGSVDGYSGGYRGGWRGRGRGRGGYRGRGFNNYGNRGGYRPRQAGTAGTATN